MVFHLSITPITTMVSLIMFALVPCHGATWTRCSQHYQDECYQVNISLRDFYLVDIKSETVTCVNDFCRLELFTDFHDILHA